MEQLQQDLCTSREPEVSLLRMESQDDHASKQALFYSCAVLIDYCHSVLFQFAKTTFFLIITKLIFVFRRLFV